MNILGKSLKYFIGELFFNLKITKLPYMPKISVVEITNACNYKCIFCPMNHSGKYIKKPITRKKNFMSFEEFKRIISKYKHLMYNVNLSAHGEPLLHPDFKKIIKYLHNNHVSYSITTNASLLSEDISNALKKYPPAHIMISLYTLDPEKYKELTQNGDLKTTLKNINYFLDNSNPKTKIKIRTLNISFLKNSKKEFLDYFKNRNIEFIFGVLNTWSGRVNISELDNKNRIKQHLSKEQYCLQPWTQVFIHSNAGTYICNNDDNRPIGSLEKKTLKEIWNSEKYISLRKKMLKYGKKGVKKCRNCDTYTIESISNKPSILFFFRRRFRERILTTLGFKKNIDWTKEKK